jgi:hypothetical protein
VVWTAGQAEEKCPLDIQPFRQEGVHAGVLHGLRAPKASQRPAHSPGRQEQEGVPIMDTAVMRGLRAHIAATRGTICDARLPKTF